MKKYKLEYAEAENGLEALRVYQTAQVQFDVILMGELNSQKSNPTVTNVHRYVNACNGRHVRNSSHSTVRARV
jgi:hypothetical protein